MAKNLNLRPLKEFVLEYLPTDSTLRELIIAEPNELHPHEFMGKIGIWNRLLKGRLDRK